MSDGKIEITFGNDALVEVMRVVIVSTVVTPKFRLFKNFAKRAEPLSFSLNPPKWIKNLRKKYHSSCLLHVFLDLLRVRLISRVLGVWGVKKSDVPMATRA